MHKCINKAFWLIILSGCIAACGDGQLLPADQQNDPVVVDIPIVFIKRSLPVDDNQQIIVRDLRRPNAFVAGAALYIKPRASASAEETNISDIAFFTQQEIDGANADNPLPGYDVKDLDLSYDGNNVLFAMRAPQIEDADEDEQPSWNIWQYDRQTQTLTRVIASDTIAEAGQDTAPTYLADGRIVFSSTRQSANQAILLDEGKPQYRGLDEDLDTYASVLHVMSSDGTNIKQISYNQSHDLDPTVLSNGKILFSRWDNAANNDSVNLYQMNADGSELQIVYGRHSHNSERSSSSLHFVQSRELPDGSLLSALRPFVDDKWGGDYVRINIADFIDNQQAIAAREGQAGPAQQAALFGNVVIDGPLSAGGHFSAAFPLFDGSGRILFSWSQCRVFDPEQVVVADEARVILPCNDALLADPAIEAAPLLYGLWMFDPIENTQLPLVVPTEGIMYGEVLAMQSRAFPADAQLAEAFDQQLADSALAQVHIRSVYDFAGVDTSPQGLAALADPSQTPADQRPARFLRIVKAVSIPDEEVRDFDNSAFGRSRSQLMREIIGYVTIEPDGSALFEVPVNVPLAFSVLNAQGRRIGQRHQNWLQFAPGEVLTCKGCHEQASELPHGRLDAEALSINQGAVATGIPFPNSNPALFADQGETMAQTAARILGRQYPGPDIVFSDIWSAPVSDTVAADFDYAYADLLTPLPINSGCALQWHQLCRIQVNYPEHIQPLFALSRQLFADDGVTLLQDSTCISCHASMAADQSAQVPAAQLDLSGSPSTDDPDLVTSYRELMFADNEQEVLAGVLVDRLIVVTDGNGDVVFVTDAQGEFILDAEGNPIPLTTTVNVNNSASPSGALASARFFAPFATGGSHAQWLSPAELKLLAEWLDIGGQYYNNPFAAPVND
jgi:hypothetical protein